MGDDALSKGGGDFTSELRRTAPRPPRLPRPHFSTFEPNKLKITSAGQARRKDLPKKKARSKFCHMYAKHLSATGFRARVSGHLFLSIPSVVDNNDTMTKTAATTSIIQDEYLPTDHSFKFVRSRSSWTCSCGWPHQSWPNNYC